MARFDIEYYFQNKLLHPYWNYVAKLCNMGEPWIFFPPAIYFILYRSNFLMHLSYTFSIFISQALKTTFQTPRPFWVHSKIQDVLQVGLLQYGWPSAHTQSATIFAVSIFLMCEDLPMFQTILLMLVPFVTGLSRVYQGVHTFVDVIGGWIIGTIIPFTIYYFDCISLFANLPFSYQCYLWFMIIFGLMFVQFMVQKVPNIHDEQTRDKWKQMVLKKTKNESSKVKIGERSIGAGEFLYGVAITISFIAIDMFVLASSFYVEKEAFAEVITSNPIIRIFMPVVVAIGLALIITIGFGFITKLFTKLKFYAKISIVRKVCFWIVYSAAFVPFCCAYILKSI